MCCSGKTTAALTWLLLKSVGLPQDTYSGEAIIGTNIGAMFCGEISDTSVQLGAISTTKKNMSPVGQCIIAEGAREWLKVNNNDWEALPQPSKFTDLLYSSIYRVHCHMPTS